MRKLDELKSIAEGWEVDITPEMEEQLLSYFDYLVLRNKEMNLTAITDLKEAEEKHFADSLSVAAATDMRTVSNLADVGSGAGFPGIPLKIVFPQAEVTLMDSLGKRVDFLNETIALLGLSGIKAVHIRAEDAGRAPEHREQYALCVSRAVAELRILAEYCLPLVKEGGLFIPYKGRAAEKEIEDAGNAVKILGAEKREVKTLRFGKDELYRMLPVYKKTGSTPQKYPRKAGIPQKRPL